MTGHMRKRGANSWQLLVHIGNDESGRKRYASKTVRGTQRQAQLALAAFVTEVARTALVPTTPLRVEEVVRGWLEAKAPRLAASTALRYEVAIRQIVPAIGRIPVARLRPRDIEDFYAKLHASGLSGSSIRKVHWAMRQSLAWALRRGYVAMIATDGVELPPLGEKPLSPPSSADVRKLIERALADSPDFGTMLAVIAWTGCRRGEACGLRWADLDLQGATVLIQRSIAEVPGGIQEKATKTGTARRIAIGPATVELLRAHLARGEERAAACGAALAPSAFVFSPDPASRNPWHPNTISHRFVAARDAAGVPKMRMHDLRHHSATTLLKSGASVGEVMDRHGWKTLAMVSRYRHLLEATDRAAAETLERA
jgi:integrase